MKTTHLKVLGLALCSSLLFAGTGCNNSSSTGTNTWSIDGVTGPTITYATNTVTIGATFTSLEFTGGITMPIPNMPNSSIEIAPNVTGGTLMEVSINTQDLLAVVGANVLPPTELPGGRPLPGVQGGTLPAIAVQVPTLDNMTFYISTSVSGVFGVFVPVNLGLSQVIGTFSYFDSSGNNVGDLSIVGSDSNGQNSGFLLLLDMANVGVQMAQRHMLQM